jgi:ketosteroid isomerase-like protein
LRPARGAEHRGAPDMTDRRERPPAAESTGDDVVRSAYGLLNTGDLDGALDVLDPEVEWVQDPNSKFERGTFRGRERVTRYWRRWFEAFEDFHLEPERRFDVAGGRILVFATFTATGSESRLPVEFRIAHLFTLRDGKIVHVRAYLERDEAMRDAGLGG